MKRIFVTIVSFTLLMIGSVASADVLHVWSCTVNEGAEDGALAAASKAWLDAVHEMEGGSEVELYLNYSIAGNWPDDSFLFVAIIPDLKTWGTIWNEYEGSPAEEADEAFYDVATCQSSTLWTSVKIE